MVNGPDSPSFYDPASTDFSQLDVPGQDIGQASMGPGPGPQTGPAGGSFPSFSPASPSSGGSFFDIIVDQIPGVGAIKALIGIIENLPQEIEAGVEATGRAHPLQFLESLLLWSVHGLKLAAVDPNAPWNYIKNLALQDVFSAYLEEGLGLNLKTMKEEAPSAISTVNHIMGFAFFMQFIVAAVEHAGAGIFANRWAHVLKDTIAKIPEEMGLSWALGLVIDKTFEAALGVELEEAINRQKHAQRIAWPQLRFLLKQHLLTTDEFNDLMLNQGFPQKQIDLLAGLQDVQLPVGDIAQLWYRGELNDDTAKARIKALGFTDTDADSIFTLYMDKSENEATVTYRTEARRALIDQLMTQDQYKKILTDAHYPDKLIESDLKAVTLAQKTQLVMLEVATIKKRYQAGVIDDIAVGKALAEIGYPPEYSSELVKLWGQGVIRRTHSMSASKVLSYLASGVLDATTAKPWLLASGMNSESADFLIAHPTAHAGVHVHALTPGLVIQAYMDGAIDDASLEGALINAKATGDALTYYEAVARYRKAHRSAKASGSLDLNNAEIKEAMKLGLINFQDAEARYSALGYTPEAALLLTEIANKGPYQPAGVPMFNSLSDAATFLESLGFTIYAPPDARVSAAEGVLAANGYSYVAPPGYGPSQIGGPAGTPPPGSGSSPPFPAPGSGLGPPGG